MVEPWFALDPTGAKAVFGRRTHVYIFTKSLEDEQTDPTLHFQLVLEKQRG